jgi:uncharacterized protein YbbC (DUF1343 family)
MKVMVRNGLDQPEEMDRYLRGQRVGLVTAGSAVTRDLQQAVDVISGRYTVTRLFNTIYGIRGEFIYGERVMEYIDGPTGLPVVSVFNRERTAPSIEMMQDLDVMVFDIKEAGTRYYEYLYCLANLMKACAQAGKTLVVLDRVAPINGVTVEGTVCPPGMHTMVGDYELPARIALTIGEFARYVNGEYQLGCDLTVVPVSGWRRVLSMAETDLPWVLPSPSLPHGDANLLYVGMCLFEGLASVNEGRGTSKPFELLGAPWMNAGEVVRRMKLRDLSGVAFGQVHYIPTASKHKGEVCNGVQIHIRDPKQIEPFRVALALMDEIRYLHEEKILWADCSAGHDVKVEPSQVEFTRYTDKLLGTAAYTRGEMDGDALIARDAPAREAYCRRKEKYHLYE